MRLLGCGALAIVVALAGGCGPREWSVTVDAVPSPAAANSSEPQLTGAGEALVLSWIERNGSSSTLKFAGRTASGWTEPVTVVSGDDWFLSYADVPSVTRLSDGTLVAQWLQATDPLIEAYNLRLTYSTDNGRTWAPSFLPHHDGTLTQHGFASLFELPTGLGLVWLDGRAIELDTDAPDGGAMSLRYAAFDRNWNQTADAPIDLRVCECCPTTAVVTADGVLTAYRDRSEAEIRDISVSRLENGEWTPPVTVHDDGWQIPACPVNGPMLSARGRDVVAGWFTASGDQGRAFAAFSADAGRTWGAPIRLDEQGSLGRVDVAMLGDGSAAALWVEFADGRSQLRLRRIEPTGAASAPVTVAGVDDGRTSGYPRLALGDGELILAWTESVGTEGEMTVRTARAELP